MDEPSIPWWHSFMVSWQQATGIFQWKNWQEIYGEILLKATDTPDMEFFVS